MIYTEKVLKKKSDALFPLSTHKVTNKNIDCDIDQISDGAEITLY